MKTLFHVLCKGRELEETYTKESDAIAHLNDADNYELSIEPEKVTEEEYDYILAEEKAGEERAGDWDFMDPDYEKLSKSIGL